MELWPATVTSGPWWNRITMRWLKIHLIAIPFHLGSNDPVLQNPAVSGCQKCTYVPIQLSFLESSRTNANHNFLSHSKQVHPSIHK